MRRRCMDCPANGTGWTRPLALLLGLAAATPLFAQQGGPPPPRPAGDNTQTFRQRVAEAGGPMYKPATAQPLVVDVRIQGNETVREHEIFTHLRTRRDREFDPELIQADVRRLAGTGKFADVDTFTENTARGVIVTFRLRERPSVRYVRFHGNRGIGDQRLVNACGIKVGDPINRFAVNEARRKTAEFYRSKGFSKVQVQVLEGEKKTDRGVVFIVQEGPVERVSSVRFVGNTIASAARLRTQIQSKPGVLWYLFSGKVDRDKIDEDVERLTAYYRNLGYFNARIGRELDFDQSGKWLTLTFVIDEGPRYRIRSISVAGNEKFTEEQLLSQLSLAKGEFFNLPKMQSDVNSLRELYGSQGHIFAEVKADPRFLEEPGLLDLTFDIEEGQLFRVGEIKVNIRGENPHTRQNVVLNRISLRPGDIVDIREVRASERRLRYSQLFRNNPAQGVTPRIVMKPPEIEELEAMARRGQGSDTYRGQNPGGAPQAPPTYRQPTPSRYQR